MDPAIQTHCVLLIDLPPTALAGIDLLSFTTTPRFRGIKNLPPGLHFVFAASDSSLAVRHGAWFYVSPGLGPPQIFVKRWDSQNEELIAETSQTAVMTWRANLGSIWKDGLTPYRQTVQARETGEDDGVMEESSDWSKLTERISPSLLSRITGLQPDHWNLSSASSAAQDLDSIPGLESSNAILHPEQELNFSPVDLKRTWREGATGRERTQAAQDRSWALGELIGREGQDKDVRSRELEVVGEIQFCFLMVLTLNNHSCLEQWKRLLTLLLTCRKATQERYHLYMEVLRTLRVQLSHCGDMEAGMFDLDEQGGGFLKPLLHKFRKSLDELDFGRKPEVMGEFEALQELVQREFSWDLDESRYVKRGMLDLEDGERVEMDVSGADEEEEAGEYAPMVVELTRAQLKALNVGSDVAVDGSVAAVAAAAAAARSADDEEEEDGDPMDMQS